MARLGTLHFQAGTELRRFIDVPEGASWAEMSIKAGAHDTPRCVRSQLVMLCTYSACCAHVTCQIAYMSCRAPLCEPALGAGHGFSRGAMSCRTGHMTRPGGWGARLPAGFS